MLFVFRARKENFPCLDDFTQTPGLQTSRPQQRNDPNWTPGIWRETEGSFSDDESMNDTPKVLTKYNEALSSIASLSDLKSVEPLTFVLRSKWEEETKGEKEACKEKVDEACRAVCKVIAPNDSEKLLDAFRQAQEESETDDLKTLLSAYRNAPTKNVKTQILSIYAGRYLSKFLKQVHAPFEKLSDRQIKKARSRAKNVGIGMNIEKQSTHRVRLDLVKLEHFLAFVDQPYFYQDVAYGTRTVKLESGKELVTPNVVRIVAKSTMIRQYFKQCKDENFEPLGKSTLYKVLKVREASLYRGLIIQQQQERRPSKSLRKSSTLCKNLELMLSGVKKRCVALKQERDTSRRNTDPTVAKIIVIVLITAEVSR